MAIARDGHSKGLTTGASPLVISHTVTSTTNGVLLVSIIARDDDGTAITGVTYNGVAMTQSVTPYNTGFVAVSGHRYLYFYHLYAPSTGANNISIAYGGSPGRVEGYGISYTGAQQSGFPGVSATQSTTGSTMTTSITTGTDNSWLVTMVYNGTTTPTGGTNATIIDDQTGTGSSSNYDSNAALTPAGSKSVTTNQGASAEIAHLVVALAPFSAATTNSGFLAFM